MTAQIKELQNINTHVVDIFGSVAGRDQPVMKMDKAVELALCLDKEVFTNRDYVFFDPFCKAGEILLAAALVSMLRKSEKKPVLMDSVFKELYKSDRYFALAPDERHWLLSLRTFYGNEKSHDKNFTQNIKNGAYLSETDGRLDKTKFNKELHAMLEYIKQKTGNKKIIAVGNPPYQEEDGGGGKSAKPVYNILIESLIESGEIEKFSLVIPARWFSGGKGLGGFRHRMVKGGNVKKMVYFENSSVVFPSVDIRGGVCFLVLDKKHRGKTALYNKDQKTAADLSSWDIIIPHIQARPIIEKVLKKADKFVSETVWPRPSFGLEANYFSKNKIIISCPKTDQVIECLSAGKNKNKIPKKLIPKNRDKTDEYQVAFPKASGGGKGRRDKILPKPKQFFILEKGQISTETYSAIHSFKKRQEAENFLSFLRTSFARFLLGLRKPTQNTSRDAFAWVPLMSVKKSWTDKELFKHFNINKQEQKYIIEQVERWTA